MKLTITREQFFDFVKRAGDTPTVMHASTKHYLDYYDRYKKTGEAGSWNWGGIWSVAWCIYRRMYLLAGALICFASLFSKLVDKTLDPILSDMGLMLIYLGSEIVFRVLFARYADYLYLEHANRKIIKGIPKRSTNLAGVIIFVTLVILALFLIFVGGVLSA